jgi:IS5 family transposase
VGRSRGGLTATIHRATAAKGRPRRLILTGGQVHEVTHASALVAGWPPSRVMADKGDDRQAFVDRIAQVGALAVIPPRSSRKSPRADDVE